MESYTTYPLDELICLVADGDELAFTIIVNRLWRNCYFHALTYTHSPQKAEEITQDIFLQVWNNRAKLKEIADFEHWFKVVARNKIISALRGKLQEIATLDAIGENNSNATIEPLLKPDLQAEYRESYQILLKGIELMPEKRREVFKLSRLEGKSNQEIAELLNIHPVTVSQYLAKSLAFLKTYLQEQEVGTMHCLLLLGGFMLY
ncbi:MAG: sigma-70 family RNA polymerase sigma factor [Candidatus Pseudobacter hemicellulosilyticus]|uniref:Sigma-70 family RNA polymerase sigma factor n=1 Tax=Candidatus Pseudobacter hemicellulosilyticus TaxID=3121375 RepID=A0AAJ5X1C4_9BACT|nr:MAG: sigma-70 family RNA polymerase sigma factor [Pseudobacter sp.]